MDEPESRPIVDYGVPTKKRRYSVFAIASFACAVMALLPFILAAILMILNARLPIEDGTASVWICLTPLGALVSLILGVAGLEDTLRRLGPRQRGAWMAVVGVVVGSIFALLLILMILGAGR